VHNSYKLGLTACALFVATSSVAFARGISERAPVSYHRTLLNRAAEPLARPWQLAPFLLAI